MVFPGDGKFFGPAFGDETAIGVFEIQLQCAVEMFQRAKRWSLVRKIFSIMLS